VYNVEVRHSERPHGGSTITLRESARRVINNIVHGTTLPLRLLSRLGVVAAGLSVLLGVFFIARWAAGIQTPPGWASQLLLTVFFGGMCLLGIGIIGRYLGVIVEETRGRPKWRCAKCSTSVDSPSSRSTMPRWSRAPRPTRRDRYESRFASSARATGAGGARRQYPPL